MLLQTSSTPGATRQLCCTALHDLLLEDMPLPDQVADGLVRVQMRSVGICGSDVHFVQHVSPPASVDALLHTSNIVASARRYFYTSAHVMACHPFDHVMALQMRIGHFVVQAPMVIGHECAGYSLHLLVSMMSLAVHSTRTLLSER